MSPPPGHHRDLRPAESGATRAGVLPDESRLGLHLPLRRRVTGYGVKPLQVVEPLYESYWLYAAVEPTTGDAFWWELPCLDADCFTLFLAKFAQHYTESLNIVLLDQAPAHVAQRVQWPENV